MEIVAAWLPISQAELDDAKAILVDHLQDCGIHASADEPLDVIQQRMWDTLRDAANRASELMMADRGE